MPKKIKKPLKKKSSKSGRKVSKRSKISKVSRVSKTSKRKSSKRISSYFRNPLTLQEVKTWMKIQLNMHSNLYIKRDIVNKFRLAFDAAEEFNTSIDDEIIIKAANEIKREYEVIPYRPLATQNQIDYGYNQRRY